MSYELRNRPRSPWSLCGTVVDHPSAVLEGLRFDSSWGLRIFSLSQARDKTKNIFMISIDGKRSSENLGAYYKKISGLDFKVSGFTGKTALGHISIFVDSA